MPNTAAKQADKRTVTLTNAEWTRIQLALYERIELINTIIADIKAKPASERAYQRLKSLEVDHELTTESLKLICA